LVYLFFDGTFILEKEKRVLSIENAAKIYLEKFNPVAINVACKRVTDICTFLLQPKKYKPYLHISYETLQLLSFDQIAMRVLSLEHLFEGSNRDCIKGT
jgi:hypothetical protein